MENLSVLQGFQALPITPLLQNSNSPILPAHVVQCRDGALKTRIVPVQVRPWALVAVCKDPRVAQLEEARSSNLR